MKVETVTFNACDWTGTVHTVKYRTLNNGTIKFKFQGEEIEVTFAPLGAPDQDDPYFITGTAFFRDREYAMVKLMKWRRDKFWTATDDDYLNGITRDHENPVAAICQILSNIL